MHTEQRMPALGAKDIGRYPFRPLTALQAFRTLAANKEDTLQVFRIIRAMSGHSLAKQYARLLRSPEGGRQAYLRGEFADRLQDRAWLAQFAPGSVGERYCRFIAPRALSAYGLADESRKLGEQDIDAAHPISWYVRRQRDVHDVWHVLTGHGTDALGEACVIAFTFGQTGNPALAFLALAAAVELKRNHRGSPYFACVHEAWRLGRRAAWLPALDYEALFAEPLAEARARLGVLCPSTYLSMPLEARNAYRYPAESIDGGFWSDAMPGTR